MRVPYGWLQELVPIAFPVEETARRLTMAGFEVEELLEAEGEPVMDVYITSNRGDALSMVGIAREAAALIRGQVTHPAMSLLETGPDIRTLATVVVEAPDLCPRYACRVIQGITIGPSPAWVQRRLLQMGVRPINNVVDATNYVMLEMGQPLHAFDLDTLTDRTIVVRRAQEGEPFTTLDGVERTLTGHMLVIADPAHPVALAGIMGGENTEVTPGTTNLLLESAHFDRTAVRKTARAHAMKTESSYRFERIVDPAGVVRALDRCAQLIVAWSGGTIATGIIDVAETMHLTRVIPMRPTRVNAVLGTDIPAEEMAAILRSLELGVQETGDVYMVTIPSFRPDLVEEMDLIEEVARIYGYEHVPTTVPGKISGPGRLAPEMAFEMRAREVLTAAGLFEALSFSLIDITLLDLMLLPGDAPERTQVVPLRNPKTEDYTHLRPTLFTSLLDALRNNAHRNVDDVQLFEIGRIFRNTGGSLRFSYAPHEDVNIDARVQEAEKLPLEQRTAGIALMGRPWTTRWGGGTGEVDFFWLKGIVEQFLTDMHVPDLTFVPATHPSLHPGRTAEVRSGNTMVALIGEVHPRAAKNFDLPSRAYLAEINLDALMNVVVPPVAPQELSRFPEVERDIAFLMATTQPAAQVQQVVQAAAGSFVESVELFDVYQGASIPAGQRSLAYRLTFRAADRTLADDEVDAAMTRVRQALVDELAATLR